MSLTLAHLGSWGNDPGRPPREQMEDLVVRDISSYRPSSIEGIIDEERPDAVVLLSTETFAHRACIRYCRQRGIPTLNLYHGIVGVEVVSARGGTYRVDVLGHSAFVLSKLYKTFRRTLPCYVGSLVRTGAALSEWHEFLGDATRMAQGRTADVAADDARTTRCCVYTRADVQHAVRTFGFPETHVVPVGNPDLPRFGLRKEMIGSRAHRVLTAQEVMYIETGLVTVGYLFSSVKAFVQHLLATSSRLAEQGLRMLVKPKPHPAEYMQELVGSLRGTGIEVISNGDFLERLRSCAACVVESTTLALVPALLGMPLLYANYGILRSLQFGPVLRSYPRGHLLTDIGDAAALLRRDAETYDDRKLEDWIRDNAGPLPAEDMPRRVTDVLEELAGSAATRLAAGLTCELPG